MKKIGLIVIISVVLMTGCSVKEGFTTFGALQNKIDEYLINVDVSDADKIVADIMSTNYGSGQLIAYEKDGTLVYLKADLSKDEFIDDYEVFYIDESLIYMVFLRTEVNHNSVVNENIIEYIIADDKVAIYNVDDSVLEDVSDDENLKGLINFLENELKRNEG